MRIRIPGLSIVLTSGGTRFRKRRIPAAILMISNSGALTEFLSLHYRRELCRQRVDPLRNAHLLDHSHPGARFEGLGRREEFLVPGAYTFPHYISRLRHEIFFRRNRRQNIGDFQLTGFQPPKVVEAAPKAARTDSHRGCRRGRRSSTLPLHYRCELCPQIFLWTNPARISFVNSTRGNFKADVVLQAMSAF